MGRQPVEPTHQKRVPTCGIARLLRHSSVVGPQCREPIAIAHRHHQRRSPRLACTSSEGITVCPPPAPCIAPTSEGRCVFSLSLSELSRGKRVTSSPHRSSSPGLRPTPSAHHSPIAHRPAVAAHLPIHRLRPASPAARLGVYTPGFALPILRQRPRRAHPLSVACCIRRVASSPMAWPACE